MKLVKKLPLIHYIIYSAIILGGVLLDQLTKLLSVLYLKNIDTCPLIRGVLHLTYVENRGAAFGMLADDRWVFLTVSTLTILVVGALLYLGQIEGVHYGIALSMILSGGIGNMIDRVALGYVVDFIDFRLINFAVFNGADSFICVGAGVMVFFLIRDIIHEGKGASSNTDGNAASLSTENEGEQND
jgi:signal peptidase II